VSRTKRTLRKKGIVEALICGAAEVLLICPPPLNPIIEQGPVFGEMFKGGVEKSKELPALYEGVAKMSGAEYLNAGSVISTDGVDGLHFTAESHNTLGAAIAAKVKEILKEIPVAASQIPRDL
jgi:lysophospholipase L1-like esterase